MKMSPTQSSPRTRLMTDRKRGRFTISTKLLFQVFNDDHTKQPNCI